MMTDMWRVKWKWVVGLQMGWSWGVGRGSRYRWLDVCRLVVPDASEYVEGRVEVTRGRLRKAEEGWTVGCRLLWGALGSDTGTGMGGH
ncbi:hypothetical protein CCUS01_08317 [Colletotrichum cuscutae]|uniref:Uncharacterized protein n=1 Tax=Colletotrichum cuscutae TaxID=1209917 RepID=A0AAI9UUH2_9PEZI|nr:hypothetical protein CCUS01_08317 [Colletotrichum cuscutae]